MKRSRPIQIFSLVMSILVVIGILTISKESVLAASDGTTGLICSIFQHTSFVVRHQMKKTFAFLVIALQV